MSQTSRILHSSPIQDTDTAHTVLMTALASCSHLHQTQAFKALNYLKEQRDRRTRILGLVQEALSQLRVDMKYLFYDLDCTRRERDAALERLGK